MKSHFLGKNLTGVMLSVRWSNPYTNPPDGEPRILWACSIAWPCDFVYREIFPQAPSGYCYSFNFFDLNPQKTWSPERKAKERLRRMKERFFKKDPLFAAQFIQLKINSQPDYYNPIAIEKEDERRKIIMIRYDKIREAEFISDCITNT